MVLRSEAMGSYIRRSRSRLSPEDTLALYVRVQEATHLGSQTDEEEAPAPESTDEDDGVSYWFAGAVWNAEDKMPHFRAEGVWENGYDDQFGGCPPDKAWRPDRDQGQLRREARPALRRWRKAGFRYVNQGDRHGVGK